MADTIDHGKAQKYASEFTDTDAADTRAQIVVLMRMAGHGATADAIEEAVVVSRAYLDLRRRLDEALGTIGRSEARMTEMVRLLGTLSAVECNADCLTQFPLCDHMKARRFVVHAARRDMEEIK